MDDSTTRILANLMTALTVAYIIYSFLVLALSYQIPEMYWQCTKLDKGKCSQYERVDDAGKFVNK